MIAIPHGLKIFIATTPIDMRKSFDGMAVLVQQEIKQDVFAGQLFVFTNKQGDKIRLFYWDGNGYCMWYKRLERGVFRIPKITGKSFNVSSQELSLILEGIELTHHQRLRSC